MEDKEERVQMFDPQEQLLHNHIHRKWGQNTTAPTYTLRSINNFYFASELELFKKVNYKGTWVSQGVKVKRLPSTQVMTLGVLTRSSAWSLLLLLPQTLPLLMLFSQINKILKK